MSGPSHLSLVDLLLVLLLAGAVFGALRRGQGVLSSALTGVGAAIGCWLIAAAVIAWAPPPWAQATASSAVLSAVPPPVSAVTQATHLITSALPGHNPAPAPAAPGPPAHQ